MALQYFAQIHPEYDYFWNWEMDVRATGHYYEFLETTSDWARKQPRKGQWERGSRFYMPQLHGKWDDFSKKAWSESINKIWGPVKADGVYASDVDRPPFRDPEQDSFEWGVGDEADLITMLPLFDPKGTMWTLRDHLYKFKDESTERRTAIVTVSRLSRRLLNIMHVENAANGRSAASEMWPATAALHHGLKVVQARHPIWFDRQWPAEYMESVFNSGEHGESGTTRMSVYGDLEHNFEGASWYANAKWPRELYKRWLGMDKDAAAREAEEGRMCLPPMLLHPIKMADL
jgi:Protein of unknown function (DUF3405)